jgi:hypothetical protein
MRINNFIIRKFNKSNGNNKTLQQGSIIRGKICNIEGNNVTIDLGNGTIINGRTQIALDQEKNKVISFLIKSISNSTLILTPILSDEGELNNQSSLINTILHKYNIQNNQRNKWIVKNLIQYEMPVDNETVEYTSNLVNSLEGLLKIIKNDSINLLGNNLENLYSDNISKLLTNIIQKDKLITNKQYIHLNENIELNCNNDINIKKGAIEILKNNLVDIVPNGKITENVVRKVLFLVKSNLKVSINNLKHLSDLIEGKIIIDKDINEIIDLLEKQGINVKEIKNKLAKININNYIDLDFQNKNLIENYYKNIISILSKLERIIKSKEIITKDIADRFDKLMDKLDFINKLNLENTFIFYPINQGTENIYDRIYLLNKRKKGEKKTDKLIIYMNLETLNLGKVEVLCNIFNNSIDLKFSLIDKKVIQMFETEKNRLYDMLSNCGFNNVNLNFKIKNKEGTDILNLFMDDFKEQRSVDIRV